MREPALAMTAARGMPAPVCRGHALPARPGAPALSVSYAFDLLDIMERRGVPGSTVIRQSGLPERMFEGMDAHLTTRQADMLLTACAGSADTAGLGYDFGFDVKPAPHGLLGFALLNCHTLRDMALLAARFCTLQNGFCAFRFSEATDFATLQIDLAAISDSFRRFVLEAVSAFFSRMVFSLGDDASAGAEAWADYPEPPHFAQWRARLVPVRFAMPCNGLLIPAAALRKPLSGSNARRARAAARELDLQMAAAGGRGGVAGQVRAVLASGPSDRLQLDAVAQAFGVSPSTLKRRLQAEGTSFRHQLEEARYARAMELLADPCLPVATVAAALGYSDMSNFCRAFSKWAGVPPSAWRRDRLTASP